MSRTIKDISPGVLGEIKYLNPTHYVDNTTKNKKYLDSKSIKYTIENNILWIYPISTAELQTIKSSLGEYVKTEKSSEYIPLEDLIATQPKTWKTFVNSNVERELALKRLNALTYHHFKINGKFDASEHQDLVFNVLNQTYLNLVIEAVAGSGKTTTIVNAVDFLMNALVNTYRVRKNIAFFCFNKSIQLELEKRLPSGSIPLTEKLLEIVKKSKVQYDIKGDNIFLYSSVFDARDSLNLNSSDTFFYITDKQREAGEAKNPDALGVKITSQVSAYTMHAYGLRCIRKSGKKVLINEKKLRPLLDDRQNKWFNIYQLSGDDDSTSVSKYMSAVSDLVDLYRLYDGKSESDVAMIANKYSIEAYDELMAKRLMDIVKDMNNPEQQFKYGIGRLNALFEDPDFLKDCFGVITTNKNYKKLTSYLPVVEYFNLVKPLIEEFALNTSLTPDNIKNRIVGMKHLHASQRSKPLSVIEYTFKVLDKYEDIDYVDMLYVAATSPSVSMDWFDIAFVDEAQDLSRIQIAMLEKMRQRRNVRIIAVGDSRQAIYGFAGSDAECFQYLKNLPNTLTLPLSVSYRCSRAAVALAKEINPIIQPHPDAREGVVRSGLTTELNDNEDVAVLCRMNAPLIQYLYKLIAAKKSAHIAGRNIADGLISMIERYKSIPEMFKKLDKEEEKTIQKIIKKEKCTWEEAKSSQTYINSIDKRLCIEAIVDNAKCKTIQDLINEINQIFYDEESGEKKKGIALSSMHKSKGLEWEKVFILCIELNEMVMGFCKQDWQVQQELNLKYVAYTRTKDWLIFISDFTYNKFQTSTKETQNTKKSNDVVDVDYEEIPSYREERPIIKVASKALPQSTTQQVVHMSVKRRRV